MALLPHYPGVLAAPAVRHLARQRGVDLARIRGSGPSGRILRQDLETDAPAVDAAGPSRRVPLSMIEQATARHMAKCWSTIPHVTLFRHLDVTALEAARRAAKAGYEAQGLKLTLTAVLVQHVAAALRRHERVNASFDEAQRAMVYHAHVNIGVAVDTPRGLVVPVIRQADTKPLATLCQELATLSEAARANTLANDQLRGGTFTITNLGALGVEFFTPIVNHPEVAILGVGAAAGTQLPLSLSFDHRALNGAGAARFLQTLAEAVAGTSCLCSAP